MASLLDYCWLIAVVAFAVGAVTLYVGLQSRSRAAFIAALVCILTGTAALAVDLLIETPTEQVRATLARIVEAAEHGDANTIANAVASDYSDGHRDQSAMVSLIHARIHEADIEHVSLAGLEMSHLSGGIEASFVAHVAGRYQGQSPGQSYPVRLKILFRREGETWKMVSIRRFDAIQSSREIPLDALR